MRSLQLFRFIFNIYILWCLEIVLVGVVPIEIPSGNAANNIVNFSVEEVKALEQFYPLAKNDLYLEYQHSAFYLIRWLRAKNLDPKKAKEFLATSLHWRKENKIDTLRYDNEMAKLQSRYPFTTHLRGKDGIPVGELQLPRWDIRKVMIAGKRAIIRRYSIYYLETMFQITRELNHTDFVVLMDLNGLNNRQHTCFRCLPFYLDFAVSYENNYPNMALYIVAINAPRLFEVVLQVVRPVMTPLTNKAVKLFGSNKADYQPFLLNIFIPEQLPKRFGGTKQN